MSESGNAASNALGDGRFLIDVTKRLPDAGGGIPAFAATSRRSGSNPLMALRVDRRAPARARALQNLSGRLEGVLTPLGYGLGPQVDGQPGWYVVCEAPSGPPLSQGLCPWSEPVLIELVLKPIALVLEQFQVRGVTHRGIRPNNVFHAQPNRPVVLGAAWAAPAAMHQPAVFETAYTALCHPAARGEGRIADDVYALGVLLVTLSLGKVPMSGLDDNAILYRKLELGDFNAITGGERLPPMLTDVVRGMLAEDPDHRPSATLLRDPTAARGRRVAARPAQRAQRPLKIGATTVWNSRTLALALALEPDDGLAAVQGGTATYWLRRALGDSALAVKLEELIRLNALDVAPDKQVAETTLLLRAIMNADILMPLCWRGLAIYPDGLGTALAAGMEAEPRLLRTLHDIISSEAQGLWAVMREERAPSTPQRFVALRLDKEPGRPVARTTLTCGLAGCVHPVITLWNMGQSFDTAIVIVTDPATLGLAWAAAGAGWLLTQVAPLSVRAVLEATALARGTRLRAARARVVEAWGVDALK